MAPSAVRLGSVQKTLLLPLWGRAVETRRPRPLLVDTAAAEIVARLEHDFSMIAANTHPITRLAWIARSIHVDRTVRELLARHPRATVVNLGCGLDTTFERVDNGQVNWIDLDLPDVVALRNELIAPRSRRRTVAASILDPAWAEGLRSDQGLMLVAAGVLYYLDEATVRQWLARTAAALAGGEIVFDAASPRGVRVANRRVLESTGMDAGAALRWGIERPVEIAGWDPRIEVLETYPMFHGLRSRLAWRARVGTLLSDALNIMSMVRLRFRA
jgi:O-methyltransferase involved in polyketide biosynthesis